MIWSPQQEAALSAAAAWLSAGDRPWFYLAGYAGTGKTTLAKHLAQGTLGETLFAAFTGKAAHVMRKAGCLGATTIHSLIYRARSKSGLALVQLEKELEALDPDQVSERTRLERLVARERENLKQPWFELNPESSLRHASLLVVDECSMVDDRIAADLLSFQVPVLVLGDPAQLPPVKGTGFFTSQTPDVCLTEVHRQARDNPIVAMATDVREGRDLAYGSYGESKVVPREKVTPQAGVQILVGKNETRRKANARCREGRGTYPEAGDRLVCLRNDHQAGVLNGSTWDVLEAADPGDDDTLQVVIRGDEGDVLDAIAWAAPFRGEEVPWAIRRDAQEFDYGYALTVHKAQGSQWPDVFVLDESHLFRSDARRHLYTAVTRAMERVTVMR